MSPRLSRGKWYLRMSHDSRIASRRRLRANLANPSIEVPVGFCLAWLNRLAFSCLLADLTRRRPMIGLRRIIRPISVQRQRLVPILGVAIAWVGLFGPWFALATPYEQTQSFQATVRRLNGSLARLSRGNPRAGVAVIDLTPTSSVPVAGFIDQIWQPYVGINTPCSARALTIATGSASVTILTADLLLIDNALAQRILARTGLARDQIYFTATHTHSGPGGWGNHPLERMVAGTYDPELTDLLTDRLARVVLASRSKLQPVEVAFTQTEVNGLQRNRIDPAQATNDFLSAWIFRAIGRGPDRSILATFVTFGAHATIAHPRPARLGADYPGALVEALSQSGQAGTVLFAAGTVGDASPVRPPGSNHRRSAQVYGEELAKRLLPMLDNLEFHREIAFANMGLAVDLPPVQVPFGSARLRFSPLAVWWVGRRETYLHVLRLGPAWLVGFPGDFAGGLGRGLLKDSPVVATSFNGDYKGYLTTSETFQTRACYETRWMNFFGGGLGESLIDLSRKSFDRLLRPDH